MYIAFAFYWFIGICTKGAQVWDVVQQFTPRDAEKTCVKSGDCDYLKGAALSLQIERDLASAASGMLLLFSIGYGIFSIWYLRDPPDDGPLQKRLSRSVVALATFFLSRNIVNFAFTLLYAQFGHSAGLAIQLVYAALWGALTVGVYVAVVFIEGTKKKEGMIRANSGQQAQGSFDKYAGVPREWPQEKPQPHVNIGTYQYSKLQTDDGANQHPNPQNSPGSFQYSNPQGNAGTHRYSDPYVYPQYQGYGSADPYFRGGSPQ